MEFLIGLGMLVFCGWNGFIAYDSVEFEYTLKWYAQTIISGFGGLYILLPYLLKNFQMFKLYNIASLFKNGNKEQNGENTMSDDKSKRDYEYLSYLRDRCIESGSVEGVELVVKLNNIMFQLATKNPLPKLDKDN